MSETVIVGFYRDQQAFRALAIPVNKDLAIVPPSGMGGYILVNRKHGFIVVETTSIDACFYLAKILIDRKTDFDSCDSVNAALKEVFDHLEMVALATQNLMETRSELIKSGDIAK
jgi:hypothetical protein